MPLKYLYLYMYISSHYICDVNKYHTVNIKFIVLFKKSKKSVPVFYRGNKIWIQVRVRINYNVSFYELPSENKVFII